MRYAKARMIARSATQVVSGCEAKERDKASAGLWHNPGGRVRRAAGVVARLVKGSTIHRAACLAIHPT